MKTVIVGASGFGRVVADVYHKPLDGFIDNFVPVGTKVGQHYVLGKVTDMPALGITHCHVAISDNWTRAGVVQQIEEELPDIEFDTVIAGHVSWNAMVDKGALILPGAVVGPGTHVGSFAIVTNANLDHDCVLGDFASMLPMSCTAGNVRIGEFSCLAMGVLVSHRLTIGRHVFIGLGSHVVENLPDEVLAVGSPARVLRRRSREERHME